MFDTTTAPAGAREATMKTTLSEIRSYGPWEDYWKHLLEHLDPRPADDEPFPVTRVLGANGITDTLWLLVRKGEQRLAARYACDCVERAVERYWVPEYPDDRRPQEAIAAARRWVDDPTDENRAKAGQAAKAALSAACAAHDASAEDAPLYAAADAANSAAFYAASLVAVDAAEATADAAEATASADAEARAWQIEHLRKLLDHAGALRAGTTDRGQNDH